MHPVLQRELEAALPQVIEFAREGNPCALNLTLSVKLSDLTQVIEYAREGAEWPLAANILDPVRERAEGYYGA